MARSVPHLDPARALASAALAGWTALAAAAPPAGLPLHPAIDGLAEVQSLDVASDDGALHLLLVGRFAQRGRVAVAYVQSADGGRTWSRPAFVDAPDAPPALSRRGNDARLAVRGRRLMAVWQARGELPGTGPMAVAYSADGGRTWTRGSNPAVGDTTRNQSHPALAADAAGNFHLAWLDDREENGNTQGLRYAFTTDGGVRWSPETTLDAAACTCCWNRLAVLPDGSIAVLYRGSDPHDMRLARLPAGSRDWRQPGAVGDFRWHFTGCPHCGGGLAATGAERDMALHAMVWTGKEDAAGLYYLRSRDAGAHWSLPLPIAEGQDRESDIAARPGGEVGLVFLAGGGTGVTVRFRSSADAGQRWSKAVDLNPAGAAADHPRIVATPAGFRVLWTEARPGGGKTWAMAAPAT